MKRVLVGAMAIASAVTGTAAFAGQTEEIIARLDALEKENSAIRRENTALSENKSLREKNTALKSSTSPQRTVAEPAPAGQQRVAEPVSEPVPLTVAAAKPALSENASLTEKLANFFGANAADLPVAYKARPLPTPGILRFWGEGGAIWSGGDPVEDTFRLINLNGGVAGKMNLLPKLGWEGAAGFDYRFTDSLYHVSGQFRYGEPGKTSASAAASGTLNPILLALLTGGAGGGRTLQISAGQTQADDYKETHWLADIAFGRDVAGIGPDAMQVKGGMRIQEFRNTISTLNTTNFTVNVGPPPIPVFGNTFAINTSSNFENAVNFLGAGPLIGIQGAVPFAGKWSFDYTGDLAVLFGTQTSQQTTINAASITPAFLNILAAGGNNANVNSTSKFATMLSGDIQAGFGYWVTPNVKVAGSYRLDALVNVDNVSSSRNVGNLQFGSGPFNFTPTRYTHGPRLTVTGQFAAN
jgi:hypothetical protein